MVLPDRSTDPHRAPLTSHSEFASQVRAGGGTRDLEGYALDKKRGYMVSLPGYEEKYDDVTEREIASHAGRLHSAVRSGELPAGVYQGGWKSDDTTYLDASQHFSRKRDAVRVGKKHKLAIYDIKNGSEIRLDGK